MFVQVTYQWWSFQPSKAKLLVAALAAFSPSRSRCWWDSVVRSNLVVYRSSFAEVSSAGATSDLAKPWRRWNPMVSGITQTQINVWDCWGRSNLKTCFEGRGPPLAAAAPGQQRRWPPGLGLKESWCFFLNFKEFWGIATKECHRILLLQNAINRRKPLNIWAPSL